MFEAVDQRRVEFEFKPTSSRLFGIIRLQFPGFPKGRDIVQTKCLIDTGACMTVIPQRDWMRVIKLSRAEENDIGRCKMKLRQYGYVEGKTTGLCGGQCPTFIGRLPTHIVDKRLNLLDLGNCHICLAIDGMNPKHWLKHALFGVGGGCMENGGLCLNWKRKSAHYVEVADDLT